MSVPREPDRAQLMVSILCAQWETLWPRLMHELEDGLGQVDYQSPLLAFSHTDYYDAELGAPITRRLLGFGPLVRQEHLADIKLFTNSLEKRYCRPDGKRLVNLDPGIVTQERLVLATGKNFTHRVYLGQGIFADLTLIYQAGGWTRLPWTFPDYGGGELFEHLSALRRLHREKLRTGAMSQEN